MPIRLSEREKEVLETCMRFGAKSDAAAELGLSPGNLYTYISRVRRKLVDCQRFVRAMNRYRRILEKEEGPLFAEE